MPVVLNALSVQLVLDFLIYYSGFSKKLILCIHPGPLERSEGFWHKEGRTDCNLTFAVSLFLGDFIVTPRNFVSQMGDFFDIRFRLSGQSQHKVELHPAPTALKSLACAFQDHFLCEAFVNHIPHTLGASLRSERQTAFAHILNLTHYIQRKSVYTQGGKRDIDPPFTALLNQKINQRLQL